MVFTQVLGWYSLSGSGTFLSLPHLEYEFIDFFVVVVVVWS
jgi:hypothetical protein